MQHPVCQSKIYCNHQNKDIIRKTPFSQEQFEFYNLHNFFLTIQVVKKRGNFKGGNILSQLWSRRFFLAYLGTLIFKTRPLNQKIQVTQALNIVPKHMPQPVQHSEIYCNHQQRRFFNLFRHLNFQNPTVESKVLVNLGISFVSKHMPHPVHQSEIYCNHQQRRFFLTC